MIIPSSMLKRDPQKWFFHDHIIWPVIWLIPNTVKPNHITVFRIILTPVVLGFLLFENYTVGIPLFIFAAITDALDGSLARIRGQITAWGTFYDPVADKILIGTVLVLIVARHVNPIIAVGIISIELMLIFGGWYRRERGRVVHANVWGKVKMFLEVVAILMVLIAIWGGADTFIELSNGTLILAIIFAVVSLLTYSL